jgi:hypothetical protein
MSKEVNMATLEKFAEAVNTGKFELFKEAVSADNVDHDPAPWPSGRARRLSHVLYGVAKGTPGYECGVGDPGRRR